MLLPNHQSVDYTLDAMLNLQAEQGALYSVVDLESGRVVEQAVLTRQADTLVIEIDGEQVGTVEQFYAVGMAASVDMGAPAQQLASNNAVAENADLVWEHAADAGAVASGALAGSLIFAGAVAAGGFYVATSNDDAVVAELTSPLRDAASIVVFDLVEGVSSSHSDRTFDPDVAYTIYIRVQSDSKALSADGADSGSAAMAAGATWGQWAGGGSLGSDATVILVGNTPDRSVVGRSDGTLDSYELGREGGVAWVTLPESGRGSWAAILRSDGVLVRHTALGLSSIALFTTLDPWGQQYVVAATDPSPAAHNAWNTMPAGMLTSQGLA